METLKESNGIPPEKFVLRCYGRKISDDKWYGVCLELNLGVEAESPEEMREKMGSVILSYLNTVIDTQDKESIPDLLSRRAPLSDWLFYYYVVALHFTTKELPEKILFKEFIPFHLAHSC
ncbi:MAG: hypothetical protein ACLP9S_18580 [Syntrophales bacterium]